MASQNEIDYALLAGQAYISRRDPANRIPPPSGWIRLPGSSGYRRFDSTGFEAISYRKGNDIVIAFTGTDERQDWTGPNVVQYLGLRASRQLREAAQMFTEIQRDFGGPGIKISFTGHSLGGGLAALLAVFFDKEAITFDPAPFRGSVNSTTADGIRQHLLQNNLPVDATLAGWTIDRESNVKRIVVRDEVLIKNFAGSMIGRDADLTTLDHGSPGFSAIDLHSITLLNALQLVPQFKAASLSLPNLIPLLSSADLFANPVGGTERAVLEHLVRFEVGSPSEFVGSQLMTHFSADMDRVVAVGGQALSEQFLNKALIAFAIQAYHGQVAGFTTELFTTDGGGVRFSPSAIAADLAAIKGYAQFFQTQLVSAAGPDIANSLEFRAAVQATSMWHVGGAALNATAFADSATLFLGTSASDALTGGSGADLLIGGDAIDNLQGGGGNDLLVGGEKADVYIFQSGSGDDVVLDRDGLGELRLNTAAIGGGRAAGKANTWRDATLDLEYRFDATGDASTALGNLVVSGAALGGVGNSITIRDFDVRRATTSGGYLGIRLDKTAEIRFKQGYASNTFEQQQSGSDATTIGTSKDSPQTVTVDFNAPAKAGDKVVLSQAGLAGDPAIVTGANVVSLANGNVEITLSEGQTQVSFALWARGNVTTNQSGTLTATLVQANPDPGQSGPIQTIATVNLSANAVSDTPPATTYTITGDQKPPSPGARDAYGNTVGGAPMPGRNDFLIGSPGNDLIAGLAGDDAVSAGGGDDHVLGGEGNDPLAGDEGNDRLEGEAGRDLLLGGDGNDLLLGQADADSLLAGGAGDDRIFGGTQADEATVFNSDTVTAVPGSEWLDGGEGKDRLIGSRYDNVMVGGAGEDMLAGGAGADTLHGDRDITITPPPPILLGSTVTLSVGAVNAAGGADFLHGGGGNDFLYGEVGADTLLGAGGDDELQGDGATLAESLHGGDFLDGGTGNDRLFGQGGNDALYGGAGNDLLQGDDLAHAPGDDYLAGEDGSDDLIGGGGKDVLYGGAGDDSLAGDADNVPVAQQMADELYGGDGDDTLIGEAGADRLDGGTGDDELQGGDNLDILIGGAGDDRLFGDGGGDTLQGGAGKDIVQGGGGDDTLSGGEGDDTLAGEDGADILAGDEGNDELQGNADNDRLDGGSGDDTLFGNAGSDTLLGGIGADYLEGGSGNDYLAGGEGFDTYYWKFGDGTDTFVDDGSNAVVFGPGIFPVGTVSLRIGSLMLDFGGGDAIHIEGFDPNDPLGTSSITEFRFDDGTILTFEELLAQGFDLEGTPEADVLEGTGLSDRINTYESDDIVIANAGDDVVDAGDGADLVDAGEGADLVYGGEGVDTLFGGDGADELYGDEGDDQLFGDEGNDTLDGGTGGDTMQGGLGDDVYLIDDALDVVAENADEGYDVLEASISATIADNIEELSLAGEDDLTGTGNTLDNYIAGNSGGNLLLGLEGDDQLDGNSGDDVLDGGMGADVMFGGSGDDLFVVDSEEDIVVEDEDFYHREVEYDEFGNIVSYGYLEYDGGYDTVESSVSFTLDQWTEELLLTGSDAIDGTGNVESNYIEGNDADNSLYGYRLNGRADTYPTGIPFLQQFSLARNAAEEMLADKANVATFRAQYPWYVPQQIELYPGDGDSLFGWGGNDKLYGSLDSDWLVGGEGDDLLYGFAGGDIMEGGAGDDTYVVSDFYEFSFGYLGGDSLSYSDYDENGDELFELEGEGTDTVVSEIDFELGEHFENLTLVADTRAYDPDGPIARSTHGAPHVGVGNEQDNVLTGHDFGVELHGDDGNDTLIGGAGSDYLSGGGSGWADLMIGGGGDDTYIVTDEVDVVQEAAGAGIDSVEVDFTYTLGANVENLYLQTNEEENDISGTGNELDNLIAGNDGDNTLSGLAGNDTRTSASARMPIASDSFSEMRN